MNQALNGMPLAILAGETDTKNCQGFVKKGHGIWKSQRRSVGNVSELAVQNLYKLFELPSSSGSCLLVVALESL